MITRVFLAPRRADLTTEACLAHWRGHHAAIGARLPRVRSYVQNHGVLEDGSFLLPYPGFDIMPELDWDSLDDMDAAIDSPVHEQDSVDDEANFIDTVRTGLVVANRHVVDDAAPASESVKLITFFRRAAGASDSSLHAALTGDYAEAVRRSGPSHHEVLLTIPDRSGRAPFSAQAIDLLWFATPRDAVAWSSSDAYHRAAWSLAGVGFGSERLIARPNRIL
jgi:uncharacterized protein (TIGR02118 family)